MNCPLIPAYSSRGQEYAFPETYLTAPMLTCMELIKEWIEYKLRLEMLCVGLA